MSAAHSIVNFPLQEMQTDAYNSGICYHYGSNTPETWKMRKYRVGMD